MVSSFREFLVEEEKIVYFTFGRINPPTIGHGLLFDKLSAKAGRNKYKIYVSQSTDPKKNPLSYKDKIKYVRKMFPKHARSVIIEKKSKNVFDVAVSLYADGYTKIAMVVGSDRVNEFNTLLKKYNGVKARHGFYNFEKIMVISAGERDPDAEGASGASASKQRSFASKNDFISFSQGLPTNVSNADAKGLFNAVRKGMNLKESNNFKQHIEMKSVSESREKYVCGQLFEEGDPVVIKETDEVATISFCGSNYLIVETAHGHKMRKWIDDVEKLEE